MPLPTPLLDDRSFQQIVNEMKKRIPLYCPEWTDHNVSDPGVTMIELFAWIADMLLYRINKIPDLHYIKMMEMLGVTLRPPAAAQAPITFWLSAPQPGSVVIPAGTAVATIQTETTPSITFSTDQDLVIHPPQLKSVGIHRANDAGLRSYEDLKLTELKNAVTGPAGWRIFSLKPQVNDALYFGFANDLSNHLLRLEMKFNAAHGVGIRPDLPPLVWEVSSDGDGWSACDLDEDTTRGFNLPGHVQLHLAPMRLRQIEGQGEGKPCYWLRARIRQFYPDELRAGARPYDNSPNLRQLVAVVAVGGSIIATHARVVEDEPLGQSDGVPGQRFQLQLTPILARQPDEVLSVRLEGVSANAPTEIDELWTEVPDFASSGKNDPHYTLDSASGELRLAPAIRQPDGAIRLYGRVPPRGATLVFRRYRQGGGSIGNVKEGELSVLKTSIPYVHSVKNRRPAGGGFDPEMLEAAMMRVPALLSTRQRAVSATDFEYLAREAGGGRVGAVYCLTAEDAKAGGAAIGDVHVVVVPSAPDAALDCFLSPAQLRLPADTAGAIERFLQDRSLLTTRVIVRAPRYVWVAVHVSAVLTSKSNNPAQSEDIQDRILRQLYRILNPFVGGHNGNGWPLGCRLYPADIYQHLADGRGTYLVREVILYAATEGGERTGAALSVIEAPPDGVLVSGLHHVQLD